MSLRTGARALGLEVTWRYAFVGPGTVVQPTRDALYLDVGGKLCKGVIDQHQDGTLGRSTSELVLRFPELVHEHLLGKWLDLRDAGHDLNGRAFSPVIVTHVYPDFDSVVASWLAQRLVEDGELPPEAEALAAYGALVDQGAYTVDLTRPETATHAIHMAFLATQHRRLGHVATLQRGHQLIDSVLEAIRKARKGSFPLEMAQLLPPAFWSPSARERDAELARAIPSWRESEAFKEERAIVDEDLERFRADHAKALCREVLVRAVDGGPPLVVPTFIATEPTQSKLNKYWVRASGFPYFICPSAEPDRATGQPRHAVFLSLDPTWKDPKEGRKPTLRGLGLRLEEAERLARAHDPTLDRGKPPRYDDGTCDNADPWYDGRGHDYTIVDAPRCGTVLPYERICGIATSSFWEVLLQEVEVCIALPMPGVERFDAGDLPPPACAEAKAPLQSWLGDTRVRAAVSPAALPPLPAGLSVTTDTLRTLPDAHCPVFRVVQLKLEVGEGAQRLTVDSLVSWLEQLNTTHHGRVYTVAQVEFEPVVGAIDAPDILLARLCPAAGSLRRGARELVLYNGRAVAVGGSSVSGADPLVARLSEMMIYAAFQAETLQGYATEIVQTLGEPGTTDGERQARLLTSETTRAAFLRFHAKYVHEDVVLDDRAAAVYAGLREALGLPAQHAKTIGDLERLADLERTAAAERAEASKEAAERKMNVLIYILGLGGLIEAGTVAFGEVPPFQLAMVGAAMVLATVIYAWLQGFPEWVAQRWARSAAGNDHRPGAP